ncbi:MAG TPA: hypothetical protein VG406_12565 [Isosphaeraceae bacterium]|jgi:hypothetical protein|nr:hypothetical protein [Isosphaeraceae bacterium]
MSEQNNDIEDQIYDLRQRVGSKQDFLKVLSLLREDCRINSKQWENDTLETYLEAMEAWMLDMEKYYAQRGVDVDLERPGWRVFADILLAARVYE